MDTREKQRKATGRQEKAKQGREALRWGVVFETLNGGLELGKTKEEIKGKKSIKETH